ncbi:hypothetical protein HMPREF1051_0157 [Neisseria sicca VK64]|uniref:Uncharacterized protein n=1 Tax=Neisseria sicca VK64 TaxID=1095748 RepID=I2NPC5_NEISI|nr:hypothetical protein HMPREF1051_0157 [Neisseria sicca VK64]
MRFLFPKAVPCLNCNNQFYLKGRLRTIFRRPFLSQVKDELGERISL